MQRRSTACLAWHDTRQVIRGIKRHELAGMVAVFLPLVALVLSLLSVSPGAAHERSAGPTPASQAGTLDGLAFSGPTGTMGMQAHHDDRLIFEGGRFRSLACERSGFRESAYRVVQAGDAIHFEAVSESPNSGTLTWRGVVRDGRVEARYTWVKERWLWTTRREYWFSGVVSEAGDAQPSGC